MASYKDLTHSIESSHHLVYHPDFACPNPFSSTSPLRSLFRFIIGIPLPLLHLYQGHLNIDYHIFSNLQNSFYPKLCGSSIFSCSSSTFFDMHQQLAQVHVLGCTELQVSLQTDSAQFVSLERLSSIQLLSHTVIAST